MAPVITSPRRAGLAIVATLASLLLISAAMGQSGNPASNGNPTTSGNSGTEIPSTPPSISSPNLGYADLTLSTGLSFYSFMSGTTAGTIFSVPFQFNTLGTYSPASVSLLLGGSGAANVSGLSLSVSSTPPSTLTLPAALTTFSATGALTSTPTAFTFTANSSPVLSPNITYYFNLTYTGSDEADWIITSGTANSTSNSSLQALTGVAADGTSLYYREITAANGIDDQFGNMGGFSIAANAVSAVPEPAGFAAIAAGVMFATALLVVRRRRTRSPAAPAIPPAA